MARWEKNPMLKEPLKAFQGDCSLEEYQERIQEHRQEKLVELIEHYGFSLDDPEVGMKLAAELALEHIDGFQIKKSSGRQADPQKVVEDAILMCGIEIAKEDNPEAHSRDIIRDMAAANGWPNDDAAIETKRRRYQALKKPNSRERKNVGKLLRGISPQLKSRLEKITPK